MDIDIDDVSGGVEEIFGERDEFLVVYFFNEVVNGYGVDEFVIVDGGVIFEVDNFFFGIDFGDFILFVEVFFFFWKSFGNSDLDIISVIVGGEVEGSVGFLVVSGFVEDDVFGDGFEIWSGNMFIELLVLYL